MAALPLAHLVFALALDNGHPGRSPYSLEPVIECGTEAKAATCELLPACSERAPQCRPPRYSKPRHAWVRMESRATAEKRFAGIARSIARTAERLTRCDGEGENACEPIEWKGTPRSLALAALTVALHESGLREDVQFGHPPLGRGPQGEACLVQVALDQAPLNAAWLSPEERQRIAGSVKRREKFAKTLLGDDPAALDRCFEVGMRMLARARVSCGAAGVPWDFGMFSMYGGGKSCNVPPIGRTRSRTFQKLNAMEPKLAEELAELVE